MAFNGYALCYTAEGDTEPMKPLHARGGRMWVFSMPEPAYKALAERRQSLYRDAELSMKDVGSIFTRKMVHTEASRQYLHMAETLDVVHISILRGHKDESSKERDTSDGEGVERDVPDVQECDGGDGE